MVRISKRMSKVLRHDPGRAGLTLDPAGWVSVADFLDALHLDRATLAEVVADSDKQRFALRRDPDGTEWIRANQGHSVPVELGLAPTAPPPLLYHGTGRVAAESIRATGINKGGRHHVHLSVDRPTAQRVGDRRAGATIILTVDAAAMAADGHVFYRSDNGVWLTDEVPAGYLLD